MDYAVEVLEEGRRSEESFRLEVIGAPAPGRWELELRVGDGQRYRCRYAGDGYATPLAPERFLGAEVEEQGRWRPVDPASLELLDTLRAMQQRIRSSDAGADSLFALAGDVWPARAHALADSSVSEQSSESVKLTWITVSAGEAWVSEALPFGGWLRYEEHRRARKVSEFAGRRFEGAEAESRELWTLQDLGVINN